jgi:iron complex outermembrane receptor protein
MLLRLLTLLLLLPSPYLLFGQELALDTIVVSASLRAQHEKETGRNIVTIKGSELQQLPVSTVDEALRFIPGIEVQQRGPQGTQADIIIRGGTFQQVLVLIDGMRLNDPLTGHFNGYIPLHLSEIERIEVLKGAAAAIYGSDAIGGVINILTKTGLHSEQNKKTRLSAGLEAGQYGLFNSNAWWRMRTERHSLSAGFISNNAVGQPLRGTTGYFHKTAASVGYSGVISDGWSISLRSAVDLRNFNAQNFYTGFRSDTAKEKVNASWQQLHLRKDWKKNQFIFDAAYKTTEDRYWFRPASTPNQNKSRLFVTQAYGILQADKKTSFTVGMQFIQRSIRSNDRGDHDLSHAAVYVTGNHRLPNNLHLNESIRLDWDGNYGAMLVPQLNFSWSPSRLTIRGSIGRGIRDADFTERYNNFNKPLVTSGSIGNPELETELSWNYEAGLDYRIGAGFKISSTFFHRSQRNLIDWTPTPYSQMPNQSNLIPTGTYALATNLSSVQTTGFESDISYRKKFSEKSNLLLMTGIIWLDSRDRDNTLSFYISSHARFLVNNAVTLKTGNLDMSLTTIFKSRKTMQASAINAEISKNYFLANLRIRYQLPKTHSGLFVQAYNLFDRSFSDLLGAIMPGRWLSAGIQLSF